MNGNVLETSKIHDLANEQFHMKIEFTSSAVASLESKYMGSHIRVSHLIKGYDAQIYTNQIDTLLYDCTCKVGHSYVCKVMSQELQSLP